MDGGSSSQRKSECHAHEVRVLQSGEWNTTLAAYIANHRWGPSKRSLTKNPTHVPRSSSPQFQFPTPMLPPPSLATISPPCLSTYHTQTLLLAIAFRRFMRRARHVANARVRGLESDDRCEIWKGLTYPTSPLGVGGLGSFLFQPPSSPSGRGLPLPPYPLPWTWTGRPARCQRVVRQRRLQERLGEPIR
jgi:hypothetical protein